MARKHLTPALLSSAVAAGLMATTMPANAVKFSFSGQINKVMGSVDNGDDSALGFFDNINSGSRIRFKGSEELDNGITIGGYQEWQMSRNASSVATIQGNGEFGEGGSATHNERHNDIWASGGFGKISLGQGNGASNGTSEVDLSGTWQTDYVGGNQCLTGGITFGNTNIAVGSVMATIDGESRNQRIRYDSPTLGDVFSFAVSLGNGGQNEVAGWLDFTVGSTQISAAIGLSDSDDQNGTPDSLVFIPPALTTTLVQERTMLSASVLLGNGLNFTISQNEMEQEVTGPFPTVKDDDDNEITFFKVGYKTGKHAFSIGLTEGGGGIQPAGLGLSNVEGEGTSFGYTYKAANSLDLYASWRTMEVDEDANARAQGIFGATGGADDIDALHAGARLTFSSN